MPELLARREIALPSAGTKTIQLIAYHMHARGFVSCGVSLFSFIHVLCNLVTTGQ